MYGHCISAYIPCTTIYDIFCVLISVNILTVASLKWNVFTAAKFHKHRFFALEENDAKQKFTTGTNLSTEGA